MDTRWHENTERNYTHLHVLGESKVAGSDCAYFWRMMPAANDPNKWLVLKYVPHLYTFKDGKRWIWLCALLAGEQTDDYEGTKEGAYAFLQQKKAEVEDGEV